MATSLVAPWTSEILRMFWIGVLLARRGALNAALRSLGLGPVTLLYGDGAVLAGLALTVRPNSP